jgi:hypothetical protein
MRSLWLLPLAAIGVSSFAWAEQPGDWGSKRPAPSALPISSARVIKPAAVASGPYEQASGTPNAPHYLWKTAVADLAERAERGEVKKEDVAAQYAELDRTRAARRISRLETLRRELGTHLDRPEVQQEYARHHRAVALLERAHLVAATSAEGPGRERSFKRIQALLYRENQRHAKAVASLTGDVAPVPKASAQ